MKYSRQSELPQWVLIAAMFALAAWSWPRSPELIPVHWNLQGEVDGYGGRFVGLLLLPLISLGLYLLLRFLPAIDPGRDNYEQFAGPYNLIRVTLLVVMAAIYVCQVAAALGQPVNMGLVVSLSVGGMLLVFGSVMHRIRPNWFVGVRTPWTLSSELSWTRTHALAGWVLAILGVLVIATGLLRTGWMFATMITVALASLAGLIVYSYVVYRSDPNRVGRR